MGQSTVSGNLFVNGEFSAKSMKIANGAIGNNQVEASAAIDATKLIHQFPLNYRQAPGANIANGTLELHICRAVGELVAIEAVLTGVAAGGDRTVSIDLKKSTGAGAFATVLTAPISITASLALRTVIAGAISAANLVAGDILQIVVTIGGASGTQPQGLLVVVTLREHPQ